MRIVANRAVPRMIHFILSPPLFPVLPRLVICPSPRGGGSIRSGLDITPSHCDPYAQAQEDQHKTCHHVQAPFSREDMLPLRRCPAPSLNSAQIMPGGREAGRARWSTRRTLQQSPRNSRQHSRPGKQVDQSFLWLGSIPCRCKFSRCCSYSSSIVRGISLTCAPRATGSSQGVS
jgi:hypothetical protein